MLLRRRSCSLVKMRTVSEKEVLASSSLLSYAVCNYLRSLDAARGDRFEPEQQQTAIRRSHSSQLNMFFEASEVP